MHTRSLNLCGCVILVHELSKRLNTSIITVTVPFESINSSRPRALLQLDTSTFFLSLEQPMPLRIPLPSVHSSIPLPHIDMHRGRRYGRPKRRRRRWRAMWPKAQWLGFGRIPHGGVGEEHVRTGGHHRHSSGLSAMVATIGGKGPPLDSGAYNLCFLFSIHQIW